MLRAILARLLPERATLSDIMATRGPNHTGSIMFRSDGRWRGRVQLGVREDGTPDVRTVYGATEKEVRTKLDKLRRDHETGSLASQEADRLFLREFLEDRYLLAVKSTLRPTTYFQYHETITRYLVPTLGGYRLSKLGAQHIQRAWSDLAGDGLSAYTVRSAHRVLHRALVFAVRWGYLPKNPVDLVEPPKTPRVRRATLTPEELGRLLLHEENPRLALLYELAVVTGARQGELLGLTWSDYSPGRQLLAINRSYGRFGYQLPKNGKTREIPLPAGLCAKLDQHRQNTAWPKPTDPIFASRTGTPLLWNNVIRSFKRALSRAGLDTSFRFHDLRHTHITRVLRSRQVPVAAVSAVAGHYSPAVTHGFYDHADDGFDAAYRAVQEGLIASHETIN